jgi:hypothetical protein
MEECRDIQGIEFDWFAVDRSGRIALFATAGSGPVPANVLAFSGAHNSIGDVIALSDFGSLEVWQSYAHAGLYVFDWSDSQGSYIRVAEPTAGVEFKHVHAVAAIPGLPRLPLSFSAVAAISPWWQDGA